jgi:hypothetical protein
MLFRNTEKSRADTQLHPGLVLWILISDKSEIYYRDK